MSAREPSAASSLEWWLTEHTLDDLGIDSLVRVKVLEWLAWKIWIASNEGSGEPDYYGKSYDPLTVEIQSDGGGVAHSYVLNLGDGGRHHDFSSLTDLEQKLTRELVGVVEWAMNRGAEDALEGLARHFYLEQNPGKEAVWGSWGDDRLEWKDREPHYDRAREIVRKGRVGE